MEIENKNLHYSIVMVHKPLSYMYFASSDCTELALK